MPREVRNFQHLDLNGRTLSSKEIRILRKFGGIAGRRLINEVAADPNHKHRDFVLELWNEYSTGQTRRNRVFDELLCDVEPGAFDKWIYEQGLQQKRTFRHNKFSENMDYAKMLMIRGGWKELRTVYRVNTNLANEGHFSYRLDRMRSYVIANNRDEAKTVWATMVLGPLGIVDLGSSAAYRHCEAAFHKPERFCNIVELNAAGRQDIVKEIERQQRKISEMQLQITELKQKAELAFALSSSTLMATNG